VTEGARGMARPGGVGGPSELPCDECL
jgi:hypothetical protein